MFNTTLNGKFIPEDDSLPNQDTLRQYILDPAAFWVLKRRANLPSRPPQRLPAVTHGG